MKKLSEEVINKLSNKGLVDKLVKFVEALEEDDDDEQQSEDYDFNAVRAANLKLLKKELLSRLG